MLSATRQYRSRYGSVTTARFRHHSGEGNVFAQMDNHAKTFVDRSARKRTGAIPRHYYTVVDLYGCEYCHSRFFLVNGTSRAVQYEAGYGGRVVNSRQDR